MKWFVSRERFDDLRRQLVESEIERRRLLNLLLDKQSAASPDAQSASNEVPTFDQGNSAQFTTPIDRVLSRFDQNFKGGKQIPSQYKARIR